MSWPESEADVARPFAAYLREMGWEVFPEAEIISGRPDMVGRRDCGHATLYYAVEVKQRFSIRLLEQAIKHTAFVHYVSIVTPKMRRTAYKGRAAGAIFDRFGLGWYTVSRGLVSSYTMGLEDEEGEETGYRFREMESPSLHRTDSRRLTERHVGARLSERQKDVVPGNADQDYWSPWRETCKRVTKFVQQNPGCTTDDLAEKVDHHYRTPSSAKTCIVKWIRRGKIEGVRIEKEGRRLYFYPKDLSDT